MYYYKLRYDKTLLIPGGNSQAPSSRSKLAPPLLAATKQCAAHMNAFMIIIH